MEILHTTNEEPFVSGTGHFAGWANRLMKLEDTAILFCREGHAHIMIDLPLRIERLGMRNSNYLCPEFKKIGNFTHH